MEQPLHIRNLFEKAVRKEASEDELTILMEWIKADSTNNCGQILNEYLAEVDSSPSSDQSTESSMDENIPSWNAMVTAILNSDRNIAYQDVLNSSAKVHSIKKWWWTAAAVLILAIAGIYFWPDKQLQNNLAATDQKEHYELPAGTNGAVLTLADGRVIVLDSMANGIVTIQGGSNVVLENGLLSYEAKKSRSGENLMNTISTPKGRQFKLQLPDGSAVWLNAASSVSYPVVFSGNERRVEVTGEVYFEVAKNAAKPFSVNANNKVEVEVLGTSFNINAYADEEVINTTLIDGAVKVISGANKRAVVIKPGQQALASQSAEQQAENLTVGEADIAQVTAWKSGAFDFNNKTLQEVMRQLERWYNLDVIYEGKITEKRFWGKVGRNLELSQCLKVLEKMGVKIRMEGERTVIVTP